MHADKFLHKLLDPTTHKSRIKSLIPVVTAIINTKELKLTSLGRGLNTPGKERAGIRRVDRLLANPFYQQENQTIYAAITNYVIGNKTRPIILVDWSGIPNSINKTTSGEHCVLRAALAVEGRGITLYDEVHSKKKEGNAKVHQEFLMQLKLMLPSDCCPIIVTDAGFKNPWFKAVQSLGWDYVGRVRGATCYKEGDTFNKITHLFNKASTTPKSLGLKVLSKGNPLETHFYIYKHKLKGRTKYTKSGKVDKSDTSKKHSSGYREPWLLVSSLTNSLAAKKVVTIYKRRMTYGFSMNENETIKAERFIVWLMISALASILAWIVGYTAEQIELHYDFQANTCRNKRVLSFFFLGCQVIRKKIKILIDLNSLPTDAWNVEI